MHLLAHSVEEACEKAQKASLLSSGKDAGFPVYLIPFGTHSSESLLPYYCTDTDAVKMVWEKYVSGAKDTFQKVHVIRSHGRQPKFLSPP